MKLFVYLSGGLGNQLFQYATARALSIHYEMELVVDDWSGFVRDYAYKREYELDNFSIKARKTTLMEKLPIWIYLFTYRKHRRVGSLFKKHWFGSFLTEMYRDFQPIFDIERKKNNIWLVGYWQSPKYFMNYSEVLRYELMPPVPKIEKFVDLGEQMFNGESVAVGVRLYEESSDPSAHAKDGRVKTLEEIRLVIDTMNKLLPNSKFYVFCTHRSSLLDKIGLPVNSVFVTHDDGYEGTIERLWLLSRCKHHIITNSSFYWWGAWLSGYVHNTNSQKIYAANNFVNDDCLMENWETF
jgi:hypothetical protein